jgi:GMP synthase PP-ATPase subunit
MKGYLIAILLISSLHNKTFAQNKLEHSTHKSHKTDLQEVLPQFPGGMSKLYDIIIGATDTSAVINNAIKEKNRGIVITQFNVDTLGKVTNIKIVEGLRNDIDNEVLRIINLLSIGYRLDARNSNGEKSRCIDDFTRLHWY